MKPSAEAVYNLLRSNPDGLCRRDFAHRDVYEVHARLLELRKEGIFVSSVPCKKPNHFHRSRVHVYRLEYGGVPAPDSCPNCGGENTRVLSTSDTATGWFVQCDDCDRLLLADSELTELTDV